MIEVLIDERILIYGLWYFGWGLLAYGLYKALNLLFDVLEKRWQR